jgi:signal transduction histidine kinase/ligand-binding sensor domain-containing protein
VKTTRWRHGGAIALSAAVLVCSGEGFALDPHKALTQYSRTVWTQEHGLPQDTIRAIAQTTDGYLWLGTDEGLARFDGYDFAIFTKANGDLPANSITALAASPGGSLWIGTPSGLTRYRDRRFQTYTTAEGLPDNAITGLFVDHAGTLWIVAGMYLTRYEDGKFTNVAPAPGLPAGSARVVGEDRQHNVLVAGYSGVGRLARGRYTPILDATALDGDIVSGLLADRRGDLWIAGSLGLIERLPTGHIRRYSERDGLPDDFVRAVREDRDGSIWAGTNGGLARLEGGRFVSSSANSSDSDLVRCLFEDSEGDLWVGANNGLIRLRDDPFSVYGKAEGLASEQPNAVFQDRAGRVWVGFHDAGLMLFSPGRRRQFTPRDGMPPTEVFSIHETLRGDLILATRDGLMRMSGTHFRTFVPPDAVGRRIVFDALEDREGRLWLGSPGGLGVLDAHGYRNVVPGGTVLMDAVVTLSAGPGGALWAGTYGRGLLLIRGDAAPRRYTMADGLSSDQIRALYPEADGTLWIGTFGGGLDAFRGGKFEKYTQKDGLLSDNIANIVDDGESLWLSTTRGICRVTKKQTREFAAGSRTALAPVNYGVDDGLRSAECAPGYPVAGGGTRTADGRLWFTTSRGLAVLNPRARQHDSLAPAVHILEVTADRRPVDMAQPARLGPGTGRLQIRYTGIHLSAPERVRYSYRLEGLDSEWVSARTRRVINYNSLPHGSYRFTVRAEAPGAPASEASYSFAVLPYFYETVWFRAFCLALLAAAAWGVYQARLQQIRSRFSLVLEERARLAREIHDTLAQGFVGISSQLDAVAMSMPDRQGPAWKYLETARRMARHSLTEARRSVMDLRASVLEGQDLAAALESGARMWTAGSGVAVDLAVNGPARELPQEVEQHLLRIAQEAVANAVKHAGASKIRIALDREPRKLSLRISDDGHGFELNGAFSPLDGHFGLIGMRERAERLGGEMRLKSHPGEGTEVEVTVPLA